MSHNTMPYHIVLYEAMYSKVQVDLLTCLF